MDDTNISHRRTRRLLAACASAFALSLAGALPASAQSVWDKVAETGVLACGAMPSNKVVSWKVDTDAGYEGYAPGFCREIAKDLGAEIGKEIKVEFQETTWSTVVLDLQSRRIDLWAGMSDTEERRKAIDMAGPLYELAHCVVNRAGFDGFDTWAEYDRPEHTIAAIGGTSDEQVVKKMMPSARLVSFKTAAEVNLAVQSGHADAFVMPVTTCMLAFSDTRSAFSSFKVPEPFYAQPSSAGMTKDDDPRFREWLQKWSEASRGSGKVREIMLDAMAKGGLAVEMLPADGLTF